jgi:hypothetical protein
MGRNFLNARKQYFWKRGVKEYESAHDGRNLAYLPTNEEHHFTDFTKRQLRVSELEDMKIIRR